jgi:hypothetical protein
MRRWRGGGEDRERRGRGRKRKIRHKISLPQHSQFVAGLR